MKTEEKQKILWFSPSHPLMSCLIPIPVQIGNSLLILKKNGLGKMFQEDQDVEKDGKREMKEDEIQSLVWNSLLAFLGKHKALLKNPLAGVFQHFQGILWISQGRWERNGGNLTWKWIFDKNAENLLQNSWE